MNAYALAKWLSCRAAVPATGPGDSCMRSSGILGFLPKRCWLGERPLTEHAVLGTHGLNHTLFPLFLVLGLALIQHCLKHYHFKQMTMLFYLTELIVCFGCNCQDPGSFLKSGHKVSDWLVRAGPIISWIGGPAQVIHLSLKRRLRTWPVLVSWKGTMTWKLEAQPTIFKHLIFWLVFQPDRISTSTPTLWLKSTMAWADVGKHGVGHWRWVQISHEKRPASSMAFSEAPAFFKIRIRLVESGWPKLLCSPAGLLDLSWGHFFTS